jgi:serine/threonine-protein phosphatase 2A regulatory subunit B
MLSSYSSADFTKQGKYIVSRDYLSVKLWDVCNNKKPILNVSLNDSFKTKLSEMF